MRGPLTETGLIEQIRQSFARGNSAGSRAGAGVELGIGDDCESDEVSSHIRAVLIRCTRPIAISCSRCSQNATYSVPGKTEFPTTTGFQAIVQLKRKANSPPPSFASFGIVFFTHSAFAFAIKLAWFSNSRSICAIFALADMEAW